MQEDFYACKSSQRTGALPGAPRVQAGPIPAKRVNAFAPTSERSRQLVENKYRPFYEILESRQLAENTAISAYKAVNRLKRQHVRSFQKGQELWVSAKVKVPRRWSPTNRANA